MFVVVHALLQHQLCLYHCNSVTGHCFSYKPPCNNSTLSNCFLGAIITYVEFVWEIININCFKACILLLSTDSGLLIVQLKLPLAILHMAFS